MKKIILIAACCAFQLAGFAQPKQDMRTAQTKIADLLAQQPAENAASLKSNMELLSSMGEEGITGLASMMTSAGKGDNTAIEYALAGYAFYVTQPGKEKERAIASDALVKSLSLTSDKENKAFIITLLQRAGNENAVSALQPYLTDERLCDPAARTLVKINSPAAQQALLAALPKMSGRNQQILAEAIGDARVPGSAKALAPLAASSDKMLAKTALYSLAHIAEPEAAAVLKGAATQAKFGYDLSNATAAYLLYAQQAAAAGRKVEAINIANAIMRQATGQVHVRTAALYLLNSLNGDKNLPVLLSGVNDADPEFREAALKYAGNNLTPAATAAWIKALAQAKKPETKAAIIGMLGLNNSASAFPAVLEGLQSKDAAVKLAAINAAGRTGGDQAIAPLLQVMKTGNAEEIAAAQQTLKTIKGDDVAAKSGAAIAAMPPAAQVALLDVIAGRKASGRVQDVLALTRSSDASVKKAALNSLAEVVTAENLPAVFALLGGATGADEIKAAQAAVIAGASSLPNPTAPVVQQMKQEPAAKQERYYAILAGLGGADALKTVSAAFANGNASQKKAAVEALSAWKDASSSASLIEIARKNADYRNAALQGFVRLAKTAATPDQRVLLLQDAMELNPQKALKKNILQQAEQCKVFPALVFAGQYLDDADVQQDAAQAVMNIALADKSYNGAIVRSLLEKTSKVLTGGDADYQRQAIAKYLAEMPKGEGFVSMFNGKDLSGWKGLVANPIKRAAMDEKTLKKEQEKADAKMKEAWSVKDGLLVFNGKGDNLCTDKKYGDFEMFVDWKITKDGDAGVYLRGTPQVQIWDTARRDVGAQVGSGGLYNNEANPSKPLKLADNAIGEWNNFRIIMKGDRVTVYLNGELVVDNVMLENYWDRKLPIFPEEQLELQAHGTYVAYRNLYVREFERPKPFTLSEQEKKEGYKILFDGTNMHQWTGNTTSYFLDNGDILCSPKGAGGGNLYTKDEFSDFVFRFEFQLTPGANNGLGIRMPPVGNAAYEGMELQILDNEAEIYKKLEVYQYHGSVYGVIPAKRGFLKPVGEWNYEQVTVKGTRIIVELNGTVILDGDIAEARNTGKTLDHKEHPGLKRDKGHIGFLGHGNVLRFRNIRVKDLSK
ncbi:family 16 glycoside hydrolase [Chitinophaga lutea]